MLIQEDAKQTSDEMFTGLSHELSVGQSRTRKTQNIDLALWDQARSRMISIGAVTDGVQDLLNEAVRLSIGEMGMMKESESVYQRLMLNKQPQSIGQLSVSTGLSEAGLTSGIHELIIRGLVTLNGDQVIPVPWWQEVHLELFIDIPQVEKDVLHP